MSDVRADHRQIRAERAPEAEARLRENGRRLLDLELQIARDLAEVERKAAFVHAGCASIAEYAARLGYDPGRALDLCWLGQAIETTPALRDHVQRGALPVSKACVVSRLLARPDLVRAGEDWMTRAQLSSLRELRRAVRTRLEEHRQGVPDLVEVTVLVTDGTRKRFERCRVLASREEKRELSISQAFEKVVDSYLERHDPLQVEGRERRVGPTADRPHDRYVPLDVVRAIARRSGGLCEVPGCGRTATEHAHLTPHAQGSGREAEDLIDSCHRHHVLLDAGVIRFTGWCPEGRPTFALEDGRSLTATPSLTPSQGPEGASEDRAGAAGRQPNATAAPDEPEGRVGGVGGGVSDPTAQDPASRDDSRSPADAPPRAPAGGAAGRDSASGAPRATVPDRKPPASDGEPSGAAARRSAAAARPRRRRPMGVRCASRRATRRRGRTAGRSEGGGGRAPPAHDSS